MGPYAQQVFLQHLIQLATIETRDKVIGAIIILMFEEEMENEDDTLCESQVFERNESSNFKEPFAMRKLCLPILRSESESLERLSIICRSIIDTESLQEFEKFLARTFFVKT
jgi:hypothetical protein